MLILVLMCTMMINYQCNESHERVRASYLHTVIKFRLSTAPFLAVAFFRAPLNPRLGDAMPAFCAVLCYCVIALYLSIPQGFFLSCPPHEARRL